MSRTVIQNYEFRLGEDKKGCPALIAKNTFLKGELGFDVVFAAPKSDANAYDMQLILEIADRLNKISEVKRYIQANL